MISNGNHHGHSTPTSSTGSGPLAAAPLESPPSAPGLSAHGQAILTTLFQKGFREGLYHDVVLHTPERSYRLHRILLAASPVLAQLLDVPPAPGLPHPTLPLNIQVPYHGVAPGLITETGMAICLSHLYGEDATLFLTAANMPVEDNARIPRSVLACATYLQGMDDLAALAFAKAKESINADTILEWLMAVETPLPSHPNAAPYPPPFGAWTEPLRAAVERFLCETLPSQGGVASGQPTEEVLQVFTHLPFIYFKMAVERGLGADARTTFAFAKSLIARRKPIFSDGEEAVVLSFGGDSGGSNVHITRKSARKPKALYKVDK